MNVNGFLQTLRDLKMVRWYLKKQAIRTFVEGCEIDPLSLVAYYTGGAFVLNWYPGRCYKPDFFKYFWKYGRLLGLPEPDIHRIFRVTDNQILESVEDVKMRILLLEACRFKIKPLEILLEGQQRIEIREQKHNKLRELHGISHR